MEDREIALNALRLIMEKMPRMDGVNMLGSFGIAEPAKDAVYSTHAIARHLLSLPDREVADGCDGIELYEDDLGEPLRPYIPAVLTADEQARRENFLKGSGSLFIRKPLQFNGFGMEHEA